MYVTHRRDCDTVGRVHAEVFGAHPPVATMVIVAVCCTPTCASRSRSRRSCPSRTRTGDGGRQAGGQRGHPWAGRARPPPASTTTRAAPTLISGGTRRGPRTALGGDRCRLVRAAAAARWLVPVVAVLDQGDDGAHGHTVDHRTEMAVVTLTAPDGRRASRCSPALRPSPPGTPRRGRSGLVGRAAQAAVAEGCQVAVVDLGGVAPTELRPSMLWRWRRRCSGTPPR